MLDLPAVLALLDAHHVVHLATAGEGGPHATPLFFARVGESAALTWISAPHVLHSRHLAADPAAAVSVGPSAPPLGRIEGVQLRGRATAPHELQAHLRDAYLARFPAARGMVERAADHHFWLFRPTWGRLVLTVAGASRNSEGTIPEGGQLDG
ncbi:MAG: pyridoxamine 5'-phosphate oxidase family protein [Myxococcota bacterium]